MTSPILLIDPETLLLDTDAARAAGKAAAEEYQSKKPYPYGGFDNFLPPEILERVIAELQEMPQAEASFDRAQERLKSSYIPERLPTYTRSLFYALNSRPMLFFLEELTGIKGIAHIHKARGGPRPGQRPPGQRYGGHSG